MSVIVCESDIARLVLEYLKNQGLNSAILHFCASSPHLPAEFLEYNQKVQAHNFFPSLEEIVYEYVRILRKVEEFRSAISNTWRLRYVGTKLSDKVIELFEFCIQKIPKESGNRTGSLTQSRLKRKKNDESFWASYNGNRSCNSRWRKRPRGLKSFCLYSPKKRNRNREASMPFPADDAKRADVNQASSEDDTAPEDTGSECADDDDIPSVTEMPRKQSTPLDSWKKLFKKHSLHEFAQVILDNAEFQTKLAKHVNQAVHSAQKTTHNVKSGGLQTSTGEQNDQQTSSSKELLDKVVKDILVSRKSGISSGVQCNVEAPAGNAQGTPTQPAAQQPAAPTQQPAAPPTTAFPLSSSIANSTITTFPRTPLIIRTALAASTTSNLDTPNLPSGSIGTLIDPNFSVSKLIVLNSNDSTHRQQLFPSISNTNPDNVVSQLANSPGTHNDDQIYIDVSNGQLTFPLFLTSDGFVSNIPFLVNTEAVQPTPMANLDASRVEVPLAEPIVVSPNQVPANCIVLGSAQKLNNEPQAIAEQRTASKAVNDTSVCSLMPSSLDSRMNMERATPSASGIVNAKFHKSLSTPRKRASHVRTLTFSPRGLCRGQQAVTPLSAKRLACTRFQSTMKSLMATTDTNTSAATTKEKPVIKNIEIWPRLAANEIDSNGNESGNTGNVPPLFVDESSNQTVIKSELNVDEEKKEKPKGEIANASKQPSSDAVDDVTPKRAQTRQVAVRRCKRQLSKSSNEDDPKEHKKVHSVEDNADSKEKETDNLMEEWIRMRQSTTNDLDSRLRELNAQMRSTMPAKREPKRKTRRRKILPKKSASMATKKLNVKRGLEKRELSPKTAPKTGFVIREKKDVKHTRETAKTSSHCKEENKEFNIKLSTTSKSATQKQLERKEKNDGCKSSQSASDAKTNTTTEATALEQEKEKTQPSDALQTNATGKQPQIPKKLHHTDNTLHAKRTANIACLLETPFKTANISTQVPPTPGIFESRLDTPLSKMKSPDNMLNSTAYLFGSLTKSELDTPLLSAVTPGFRFTPLHSSKETTPRTMVTTEYSSGGSYYKPDESEDLDKNIDRLLRDSDNRKQLIELEKNRNAITEEEPQAVCVELPVEKLKVEPIVLKRVKSFTAESVENVGAAATSQIDPHYTLVSGLPDMSEDESESSSSNSSTTSSSSSTSSTSSAEQNSPLLEKGPSDTNNKEQAPNATISSLNNLSDISSAEDEDWQKLNLAEEENSQLISNSGEVRYPVRSWLTPSKEQAQSAHVGPIVVPLPLKLSEKWRKAEAIELEEKRERMKEKIKRDSQQKSDKPLRTHMATRSMQPLRGHGKRSALLPKKVKPQAAQTPQPQTPQVASVRTTQSFADEDKRPIDVLTALNLSAKKKPVRNMSNPSRSTATISAISTITLLPADIDDNAISVPLGSTVQPAQQRKILPPESLTRKLYPISSVTQRKCLQIEALPTTMKRRQKKFVRTQLEFKQNTSTITSDGSGGSRTTAIPNCSAGFPISSFQMPVTSPPGTSDNKSRLSKTNKTVPKLRECGQKITLRKTKTLSQTLKTKACIKPVVKLGNLDEMDKCKKIEEMKEMMVCLNPDAVSSASKAVTRSTMLSKMNRRLLPGRFVRKLSDNKLDRKVNTRIAKVVKKPEKGKDKTTDSKPSVTADSPAAAKPEPKPKRETSQVAITEEKPADNFQRIDIPEECTRSFSYKGTDQRPLQPPANNLADFKMIVQFSENSAEHIWQPIAEICLYESESAQPIQTAQTIRNIPKKRQIYFPSTVNENEPTETQKQPKQKDQQEKQAEQDGYPPPKEDQQADQTRQEDQKPETETTTSAPPPPSKATCSSLATSEHREASKENGKDAEITKKEEQKQKSEAESGNAESAVTAGTTATPAAAAAPPAAPTAKSASLTVKQDSGKNVPTATSTDPEMGGGKIQIEDIESILSHLHGM